MIPARGLRVDRDRDGRHGRELRNVAAQAPTSSARTHTTAIAIRESLLIRVNNYDGSNIDRVQWPPSSMKLTASMCGSQHLENTKYGPRGDLQSITNNAQPVALRLSSVYSVQICA